MCIYLWDYCDRREALTDQICSLCWGAKCLKLKPPQSHTVGLFLHSYFKIGSNIYMYIFFFIIKNYTFYIGVFHRSVLQSSDTNVSLDLNHVPNVVKFKPPQSHTEGLYLLSYFKIWSNIISMILFLFIIRTIHFILEFFIDPCYRLPRNYASLKYISCALTH